MTLLVVASGAGDEDSYEVRAIFDNGAFLAPDEDVRVAGANVGTVADLDVTFPDEAAHADGSPDAGKAVVVMTIDDPALPGLRARTRPAGSTRSPCSARSSWTASPRSPGRQAPSRRRSSR